MELELDMMELQCTQEISSNNDPVLDDYIAQYEDFISISSFQEPQQYARISPRCTNTTSSHNYAATEFDLDEGNYAATGSLTKSLQSPFDHADLNYMLNDSGVASRKGANYDQQTVAAGRLMFFQESVSPRNSNYQLDYSAGLGIEGANTAGLEQASNEGAARPCNQYYDIEQLAGISAEGEEEGMIACSSNSSSKEIKKKKSISGTLSSSSCKPTSNKREYSRLKVHKDSHSIMITKRAAPFIPPPQYRRPIIIHTYSPKAIHTSPSKFMWLVQSLTGSSETRSRCLKDPPHDHLLHGTSSAVSMEAQDIKPSFAQAPSYHHGKPHSTVPMQASMERGSYHHDKYSKLSHVHQSPPSPLNSHEITATLNSDQQANYSSITPCIISSHNIDQCFTSTSNSLILTSHNLSPRSLSSLSPTLTNYIELGSNTEQSSSSTSCCSTIEVSPRGPLISTREFEGAHAEPFISGGTIITPPAPIFERWPLDRLDSMEGSVHSSSCLANCFEEANPKYLSNLKSSINISNDNVDLNLLSGSKGLINLQGPNERPCNHVINSTPLDLISPYLTQKIPMWDSYPIDTFLHSIQEQI